MKKICIDCGCFKNHSAKGLCSACYRRQYIVLNPEYKEAQRKCVESLRAKNPEKYKQYYLEYGRKWRLENPEKRQSQESRRRIRKNGNNISMSPVDLEWSNSYRRTLKSLPCVYCGDEMKHIDHATPISRGGSDHWWNLFPACASCNTSKKARTMDEFVASRNRTNEVPEW